LVDYHCHQQLQAEIEGCGLIAIDFVT
jgi:hypothetical protein